MKQGEILNNILFLGFFDGIHTGHRAVIKSAVNFAKEHHSKTILLTFTKSPAEYFNKKSEYIYPREFNYSVIRSLGIDEIVETEFSTLKNISAEDYLKNIVGAYSPIAIFTGFNYTFGAGRIGTVELLKILQQKYNYEYHCIKPVEVNNQVVSSTLIKKYLTEGFIEEANNLLEQPFYLEAEVVKGKQLGRTIGFPTANMIYPQNTVQIPYGVYKVNTLGKTAVLNWGVKPTVNGKEPVLETHIPDFSEDLYGQKLRIQIIKKIRSEIKFDSLTELKQQIQKDIIECLE